jgi:hypothetical protein
MLAWIKPNSPFELFSLYNKEYTQISTASGFISEVLEEGENCYA